MNAVAHTYIVVLSLLVLTGGIMGFVKAASKASLIAGVVSAVLLLACYLAGFQYQTGAFLGAFAVASALDVVFAIRLAKTKKFMPSGLMIILCVVLQILTALALLSGRSAG